MTTRIPEGSHGGVETRSHLKLVPNVNLEKDNKTQDIQDDVNGSVNATVGEPLTAFDRIVDMNFEVAEYVRRFEDLGIDSTIVRNMFVNRCDAFKVFGQFRLLAKAIIVFYERFASREQGVHMGLFREHVKQYIPFRREAERVADMIAKDPDIYAKVKALYWELDCSVNNTRHVPSHAIFKEKR